MNQQTRIIKSLTQEEQELLCFFRPLGYHTRMQQYLEYPEAFVGSTTLPGSTVCLSATKTFRHYLRRFVSSFQPIKLLPEKDLWLHIENNGRFFVRLGETGEEITKLTEPDTPISPLIPASFFAQSRLKLTRSCWPRTWTACTAPIL